MDTEYISRRFSLDGKKAIVTGASKGIGRAIAESLARFGAEVTALGRDEVMLKETEEIINGFGGKCDTARFDLTDREANEKFFREYEETHGAPDIYIANAGATVQKHILDTTEEDMDKLIDTDLKGLLYGVQWAGKHMKEKGGGNIVLVTSVNALYHLADQGFYTAIKCALEGICRCLATDLGRYGVRVNTLAPGAVNTYMGGHHTDYVQLNPNLPMGHRAQPEEMGDVVACMVSDPFGYMTGATVLVDGGLMLRPTKY